MLRYSGGLIKWTKEDLRCLDVLTRKQLTLYHAFHIKGVGRGLLSVIETISSEEKNLSTYIGASSERQLQLIPSYIHLHSSAFGAEYEWQVQSGYSDTFIDKPLHGQYFREIMGQVDDKYQWAWLSYSSFTSETEGFIMALQEQVISTT